ncbi:hypothetical protein O181_077621 [Austropuccinia psidii MF-1]|uniref:Uncharacterized protein n=1 Tax=Austropuccinia psidii MF-1 TaxID=1389203 RepID=A0A9Q3FIF1_9BASI|nr:hypothetical protein [Austropuccinia psidii MF-1]
MSSSKPHKYHSGSVHVSDSESSIEYVQTQSPMSPNIPLKAPIASSMNVSCFNIDVGIQLLKGQALGQSQIFLSPQFPQIPLIHKCMFLRGQEAHLKSHQRLISNENFHVTSSLILVGIQSRPRNPLGKICNLKARQSYLRRQSKIKSLPLVHKEKVTGLHYPYASKPRTAHASSSSKEIVDDEDDNMSPNHSETNDELRRDNFMAHEEGTQSNSEFTHPQMPLSQSILEQSKIRQQSKQAFKAHNVAKHASQKEQQRWLKAEVPENVHGMRSAVNAHCPFLLKVRDKDFSSLPAPPSTEKREIVIQVSCHLGYVPKDFFNETSTQFQSQGFQIYCKNEYHKVGLK